MLHHSNLDASYWVEAITTTTYVKARSPHKAIGGHQKEFWSGRKHIMKHLQVCDYDAHAHRLSQTRTKLKFDNIECIFVGYDQNSKAYRLINKETLKLILQRNVVFNEAMWFSIKKLEVAFKNEKTCHKKNTNKSFLTSRNTSLTLIKTSFRKVFHLQK